MGSGLIISKRWEIFKAIEAWQSCQLDSSDGQLIAEGSLLDIGITKSIYKISCKTESCLELSSDRSPVTITLNSKVITSILHPLQQQNRLILLRVIDYYSSQLHPFKNRRQHYLCNGKHQPCNTTSCLERNDDMQQSKYQYRMPLAIKNKLAEKRKLRKLWRTKKCPALKTK